MANTTEERAPAVAAGQTPRARRAPLVHTVMCRFDGQADFVDVTTLNISESGMLVRGDVLPPVGSGLEFKFFLETGFEILSGQGTVMRHAREAEQQPSVGIAFGALDSARQRILRRIVDVNAEVAA
jgi:hypothetical protein